MDNSTAVLNPQPNDSGGTNNMEPISVGSLFGMFLTLNFCLMTQPSGNLVFWWDHAFLSRINPMVCVLESGFIVYQLAKVLWTSRHSSRRWKEVHLTVASLLLIRANPYSEGEWGAGLLNDLMDGFISDSWKAACSRSGRQQSLWTTLSQRFLTRIEGLLYTAWKKPQEHVIAAERAVTDPQACAASTSAVPLANLPGLFAAAQP
ncbi:unnamed protein product [Parascedosporium putredinis]|uniref:Uncharacterized protein n=1 Tax=Parascedosporium putredinis TaxID=1442378 RepID=A0A9P1M8S2_9PEZI|nr:unnamed protein product [Parascedosporium putredinis]CAI7994152.1 unnamed protein product [Parascedosporium putredinis]